jgi:membrane dipeptidase
MLDHIDHAVKKYGADRVAIGTDTAYSSSNTSAEAAKVPKTPRARTRFEALWPPDAFPLSGPQPSLAWTNWPAFTVGMVQRGHSDDDIRKVLGGNVLRVARAALEGIA